MKKIFLGIWVTFFIPITAHATVIEFNSDGSVTTYVANDYLAKTKHTKKHVLSVPTKSKQEFDGYVQLAAEKYGVDQRIVFAVIETESSYKPFAVSSKGALGLMQILPSTAALYGEVDLLDPEQNINTGTRHLKYLLDKYDGDLPLALGAYNAGEGAVNKYDGIPPYPETVEYVKKVIFLSGLSDSL